MGLCTTAALGVSYDRAQWRAVRTLSGGEQKRLVLEALLRGPDEVLLLTSRTTTWTSRQALAEDVLRANRKTVLYVSHDRELLARTATRVVTLEGGTSWVHGGRLRDVPRRAGGPARALEEVLRTWEQEHERLKALVAHVAAAGRDLRGHGVALSRHGDTASAVRGAGPERPSPQRVRMRLTGGRTGVRVMTWRGSS